MSGAPSPSPARANRRPDGAALEPWRAVIKGRDFYPTPPWATRALTRIVLPRLFRADPDASARSFYRVRRVWEPCAGMGHMVGVLHEESGESVAGTDLHAYADTKFVQAGFDVRDAAAPDDIERDGVDWIITNPPFTRAEDVLDFARVARVGIALLLPLRWLNGEKRHKTVFAPRPPTLVAPFCERVAMVEGGWDPWGKTADAHAWFVWLTNGKASGAQGPDLDIIPPCRRRLTLPSDLKTYAPLHVANWAPPRFVRSSTDLDKARQTWRSALYSAQVRAGVND